MVTPLPNLEQFGGKYLPIKVANNERHVMDPGQFAAFHGYGAVSMQSMELYNQVLLWNFGYNMYPSPAFHMDVPLWERYSIENMPKEAPIAISGRVAEYFMVNTDENLFHVLGVLRTWGRAPAEAGQIIIENKSFELPPDAEVQYRLENNILVTRTATVTEKKVYWNKNDIFTRRLYNISPYVDNQYFCNCFRDFTTESEKIKVKYPHLIFAIGIVNPDLLMSILKESEIAAAKLANETEFDNYSVFRTDESMETYFSEFFNQKIDKVKEAFDKGGFEALIKEVVFRAEDITAEGLAMNAEGLANATEIDKEDSFSHLTKEEKEKYIESLKMEDIIDDVAKYIDLATIPNYLKSNKMVKGKFVYDKTYAAVIKRLSILLEQIEIYHKGILSSEQKMIVSAPFFKNPNRFVLYNPKRNVMILINPDYTFQFCNAQYAIQEYKEKYGEDVLLNPAEMELAPPSNPVPETIMKSEVEEGKALDYVDAAKVEK